MSVQVHVLYKELPAMQIENECRLCGDLNRILVEEDKLTAWWKGAFIQDAFPDLSKDERELIMTGTHKECWDAMFGSEED